MDITLNHTAIFPRGRRAQEVGGGQQMADNIAAWIGAVGGAVTVSVAYLLNKGTQRRHDEEAARAAIMTEAIAMREGDRRRLTDLETWRDGAMKTMDSQALQISDQSKLLQIQGTDKVRLEALVLNLEQQVAILQNQITDYKEREISHGIAITDLQNRLASKSTELHTAQSRLQAIKDAADKGEVIKSVLFQGQRHAEVIDVVEVELDPD